MSYDIEKVEVPRYAIVQRGDSGYGFNLHGDKNQPGQTISAVDKDSPAERGGLREGDRLIEVNGVNVESKAHGDVVKLIKGKPTETALLVCDKDTLAYLKAHNRECTIDMVNLQTVIPKPEEPAPVVANGDATTEIVQERSEESAPSVEDITPPPAQVTKDEDEAVVAADTTPEEVKELNSVLDEQETPPEPAQPEEPRQQEQTDSKPAAVESPTVEEPAKPADNSGLVFDMKSARPSGNKRKSAKTGGEWSNKVSMINSM